MSDRLRDTWAAGLTSREQSLELVGATANNHSQPPGLSPGEGSLTAGLSKHEQESGATGRERGGAVLRANLESRA